MTRNEGDHRKRKITGHRKKYDDDRKINTNNRYY